MELTDLFFCSRCSALVVSVDVHDEWHRQQTDLMETLRGDLSQAADLLLSLRSELEKAGRRAEVATLGAQHALEAVD